MMRRMMSEPRLALLALVLAGSVGVVGCGSSSGDDAPPDMLDAGDAAPDAADSGRTSDAGSHEAATLPEAASRDGGVSDTSPIGEVDASDAALVVADAHADAGPNPGPDAAAEAAVADSGIDSAAPQPVAAFAGTAIDFGPGDCGGNAVALPLVIQNTGSAALIVNASVSGAAFAVSPTTLTVTAGQSGTLNLTAAVPVSSTAGSSLSGSLTITTNDTTHGSTAIPVSVTPHGGTLAWGASSPVAANFGIATLNQNDTNVALTLQNTGNASLALVVAAPSNAQFSITPSASVTLAAGVEQAFSAGFLPTTLSASTATSQLTVVGAVCGTSITAVSFSGQGGQSDVTGWPSASLDFGQNPCGGAAPGVQTFTLHNSGSVAAHITSATLSGVVGYSTDAVANATIAVNGDLIVSVHAPAIGVTSAVPGNYAGTLTVVTDVVGDSPHQITLTESALGAVLAWDTSSTLNFGAFGLVPVGTSGNQGFSVVNNGNAPANVTVATATPFSVGTPSFNLAGQGTQSNTASFTPSAYGGASATLGIATASVLCQPLPSALTLAGTGQAGGISLSTQSMAFSSACGGPGSSATFTITNTGNVPMTWTASLAQGGGSAFTFLPAQATLSGGSQSTITVTPNAVGMAPTVLTDTLAITTDIAGDTAHTVSLSETPLGDVLSISPVNLVFGGVPVSTPGQSKTLSFDIVNNANDGSPAGHVNLTLSDATHYTLDRSSVSVAAGGHETVQVTFAPGTTPSDAVARTGLVTLALGGGDALCASAPGNVSVSGTGTLAQVSISANELDFGAAGLVNCGATAAPQTVVLTNTGNQDYTITGADLDNPTHFTVSRSPADGIVHPNGSVTLTVTPSAIPTNVATVPSMSTFSGTLVIHTDAPFDAVGGHSVALVMGAQGAIIDNVLTATNWNFGTVNFGSTGYYNLGIRNHGNATAQVALVDTTTGSVFGLASNPTTVAAGDGSSRVSTSLTGTFTPSSGSGTWADMGTLLVTPTTGNVFCQPLGTWAAPSITLAGMASNNPVITVNGALSFPSSYCDGSGPPAQSVTITNASNAAVAYTASLDVGSYYTLGSTSGSVVSNGSAPVTVTAHLPAIGSTFPGTGSTPYDDRLRIVIGATTYVIPISLTVTGTVLTASISSNSGYFSQPFAFAYNGPTVTVANSGNLSANVTSSFSRDGFYLNPSGGTAPAGSSFNAEMFFNGSGCLADGIMTISATSSHVCQTSAPIAVQGCN